MGVWLPPYRQKETIRNTGTCHFGPSVLRIRLTTAVFIVAGATLIGQVGLLLRSRLDERILPSLQCFVKAELLDRLLIKHSEHFANLSSGEVVYILATVPDIVCLWFRYLNEFILPYVGTFIIATIVIGRFDRPLGLLLVAFAALLYLILVRAPRMCLPMAGEHSVNMGLLHDHIEELVQNMEAVFSHDRQGEEVAALHSKAEGSYFDAFRQTSRCSRRHKALTIPLTLTLLLLVLLRSGRLVTTGRRTPEAAVGIFFVVTSLINNINSILNAINGDIFDMGHLVQAESIFGATRHPNGGAPKTRQTMEGRPPPGYAVGLVGVSFGYEPQRPVLHRCTVHFERGECTNLVGGVGTGKTTALRLLLGLHVPHEGDGYYEGNWYGERPIGEVRRIIGYIPQHPVLFDRTVLENVMYGNEGRITLAAAAALIAETGLAARLSNGVHTRVGKAGLQLSGGQRQLVWCLRVLLQDPPVLIMDEPTASMDVTTKDLLFGLLDRLMHSRTVIFVSHDPYLVARATRSVSLS